MTSREKAFLGAAVLVIGGVAVPLLMRKGGEERPVPETKPRTASGKGISAGELERQVAARRAGLPTTATAAPRKTSGAPRKPAPETPAAGGSDTVTSASFLRLDLLEHRGERKVPVEGRNIFGFKPLPPPPPPPPSEAEKKAIEEQNKRADWAKICGTPCPLSFGETFGPPPAPPPPPPPPPPPAPVPPAITFKFIGTFGPAKDPIAVFQEGKELINARKGETFLEKFIVRSIGVESAEIGFVGFPETQVQRVPLAP